MPTVTLKQLSSGPILETFQVSGGYQALPFVGTTDPNPPHKFQIFEFLYSNIDGTLSKTLSAPPTAGSASFWYIPTDVCSTVTNGHPGVSILGFDATQDVLTPLQMTVDQAGKPPSQVQIPATIDTTLGAATVQPPPDDAVAQNPGFSQSAFKQWFSYVSGQIVPSGPNGVLSLTPNESDELLCVYSAHPNPPGLCTSLLASLENAENSLITLTAEHKPTETIKNLITVLKQEIANNHCPPSPCPSILAAYADTLAEPPSPGRETTLSSLREQMLLHGCVLPKVQ